MLSLVFWACWLPVSSTDFSVDFLFLEKAFIVHFYASSQLSLNLVIKPPLLWFVFNRSVLMVLSIFFFECSLAPRLPFALYLVFSATDVHLLCLYDHVSIYPSKASSVLDVPFTFFLKSFLIFTQFPFSETGHNCCVLLYCYPWTTSNQKWKGRN